MAGIGPLYMLAILQEYATAMKPKILLWNYYESNDLSNLNEYKCSSLLKRYIDTNFRQDLIRRQPVIDAQLLSYLNVRIEQLRIHGQKKKKRTAYRISFY